MSRQKPYIELNGGLETWLLSDKKLDVVKKACIIRLMFTPPPAPKVTLDRAALIRHRSSNRLSQGALAALAAIDQAIISRAETGVSDPSMAALSRIASALEVEVSDLLQPADGTNRQGVCRQCLGLKDR